MTKKGKGIDKDPRAKQALEQAVAIGLNSTDRTNIRDVRGLLASPGIRDCMEDILNTSSMSEPMKVYIRELFFEKKSQKKAIAKAFGTDLGYQEEIITAGVMNHVEVKRFLEMIKLFYVQVSPIASLKEVEILLKPTTTDDNRLKAIESIHKKAGLLGDSSSSKKELPVQLVINMPKSDAPATNAVQVNVNTPQSANE